MYNFINDKIVIKEKLPVGLQEWVDNAEQADRDNSLGFYCTCIENIDVIAKNCVEAKLISMETWDLLNARYC